MKTRLFLLFLCLVWVVGCDGNRDPDDVETGLDDLQTASIYVCNEANCTGGPNDLEPCTDDSQCPDGTCEIFAPINECDGGALAGRPCVASPECGSACVGGPNAGVGCFIDDTCGQFCVGGDQDGQQCGSDAFCLPGGGTCEPAFSCVAGTCEPVDLGCNQANPLLNFDLMWDSCQNLDAVLSSTTLFAQQGSTTGDALKVRVSGCDSADLRVAFSEGFIGCVSVEFDKEGEAPIQACDNPIALTIDVP